MKRTSKKKRKHEIYNNEDQHNLSLNASTEKKRVKAKDKNYVDLTYFCDALHANDNHTHSLDYEEK